MDIKKRVVVINDLSGIGKCSLTVAIPLLSALNIEVCPVPTAILSNQTGFNEYSFLDLTDNMKEYLNIWQKNEEHFDCIYTGFLASDEQIDIIKNFIKFNSNAMVVVDPIMGDDGVEYDTHKNGICTKMKELINVADIVTPNITEAMILLDKKGNIKNLSIDNIKDLAIDISKIGPKIVIITGIILNNQIINIIYNKNNNKFSLIELPYNNISYSGTGDIFSSLITGFVMNGLDIEIAAKKASNFILKSIEETKNTERNPKYGIEFENLIKDLVVDNL